MTMATHATLGEQKLPSIAKECLKNSAIVYASSYNPVEWADFALVSPTLLDIYVKDGMTLDMLMAFTVSEDQAHQEEVWQEIRSSLPKEANRVRELLVAKRNGKTACLLTEQKNETGSLDVRAILEKTSA